jgi:hypothetical protein
MGSTARPSRWLEPGIVLVDIDGSLTLKALTITGVVNDWKRIFCVFFIWAGMWVDEARHEGNSELGGSVAREISRERNASRLCRYKAQRMIGVRGKIIYEKMNRLKRTGE